MWPASPEQHDALPPRLPCSQLSLEVELLSKHSCQEWLQHQGSSCTAPLLLHVSSDRGGPPGAWALVASGLHVGSGQISLAGRLPSMVSARWRLGCRASLKGPLEWTVLLSGPQTTTCWATCRSRMRSCHPSLQQHSYYGMYYNANTSSCEMRSRVRPPIGCAAMAAALWVCPQLSSKGFC